MNIQDLFPLGWAGWISLQSKGLSRVFSKPQFKSIHFSVLSFLYGPTFTLIHDYWKTIGEGSGTPLQYSCLENPMDGGAW